METKRVLSSSGSIDSISPLPDELLSHILSFLPTKRAASTSILSKRWRTLFPFMNHLCASLYLDDTDLLYPERQTEEEYYVVHNSFRNFVDKTLSGCNNNSLKKFSLTYEDDDVQRMCLTTGMMSKALEQGVSDLELCIYMPLMYEPPRLLPDTVFINNTLVKLTLGTELCLGRSPWEDLEELYIHHIYIEDRDEEFDIHTAPHYIAHNIKKLTVCYNNDVQAPRILSIYTPNLVYLDYSDYLTCLYNSENHFNDLLEARLDLAFARAGRWGDEHDTCLKIMNSITNVQILHLSCFTVENLATLHFEGSEKEYWQLLCNMIEKSPKLETLVLEGLCGISDCEVGIDGGNMVKVVEIQEYKGRLEELNQVKCFLREMENLEEVKVNTSDEIENKLQLTNDLLALLPKRSSKCNIHVL
ncbi:putative F-box protein [Arabidopsis thaliana]